MSDIDYGAAFVDAVIVVSTIVLYLGTKNTNAFWLLILFFFTDYRKRSE